MGYQNLLKSSRKYPERELNRRSHDENLENTSSRKYLKRELNRRSLVENSVQTLMQHTVSTLSQNFRHFNSEKHCLNSDPAVTLYCLKHCPWQLCSKLGILQFLIITVWTLSYENSVLITVSTVLGHWIFYCYFSVATVKNHCCMRIFKCAWAVFG